MATYTVDKFEFGSNTYIISDSGALQLTGGTVTGPVSFRDSISVDDATLGNLVVNGSASFTNNLQVNKINEVAVGASPKFTDTVTTVSTTGSGNAVTAISASNGALTVTKGTTFLTSHQDISGKADKSATVSTVTYDSTNKKLTKTINGTTTDVVTVATLKTAMDIPTYSSGTGIVFSMVDGSPISINHSNSVTAQTTQAVYPIKIDAQGHISAYGSAVTIPTIPSNNVTGSGTSGYLVKFNGANTITNGPAIGTGTTKFLREDGTWAVPGGGGTVTSVDLSNATNGGLSISGGPITGSGTITVGHSNVLTSAQTTQAVYPIKIDKNGHISAYGSAVTIPTIPSNNVTGSGTSGYLAKFSGANTITSGPQLGSDTATFLRNDGVWASPPQVLYELENLSVSSEFVLASASEPIQLRRYGEVVSITGIVNPKSDIAGAITRHNICTMDSKYAPQKDIHLVMHGSGNAEWLLSILTTGEVQFSRYRNTASAANSYNTANSSQWLPFHATWIL